MKGLLYMFTMKFLLCIVKTKILLSIIVINTYSKRREKNTNVIPNSRKNRERHPFIIFALDVIVTHLTSANNQIKDNTKSCQPGLRYTKHDTLLLHMTYLFKCPHGFLYDFTADYFGLIAADD